MNRDARRSAAIVLACVTLLAAATPLFAQSSASGSLNGRVADLTGGRLPGVTVVATQVATSLTRTTVSSADGEWTLSALPVGVYTVSFELQSFKRVVRDNVAVEA